MSTLLPPLPPFNDNITESLSMCSVFIDEVEKYSKFNEDDDPEQASELFQELLIKLSEYHDYLEKIDEYIFNIEVHSMGASDVMSMDVLDSNNLRVEELRSRGYKLDANLTSNRCLCAETLKDQGNVLFKNGDFSSALKKYNSASKINPSEPTYYTNSALALQRMELWREAIDYANKSIDLDVNYLKGYIIRTKSFFEMNSIEDAVKSIQEIPDAFEGQHDVIELTQLFSLKAKDAGNVSFKDGNYERALELYSLAIQFDNENHLYYSNRSACYQARRQWKEGKEDGLKVIELKELFPKGYIHVIRCQIKLNEFDQASSTLLSAITTLSSSLPPSEWVSVQTQFNNLELEINNAKTAATARSTAHDKSRAESFKAKGNQLYQSEQYQDAIRQYSQAIAAYPEEGTYFGNRAACWMMLKEFQQAINDCNQGLTLEKDAGNLDKLRLRLLDGLTHTGKVNEALEFIREYNIKRKNAEQIEWFHGSSQFQEKYQTLQTIKQNIESADAALLSNEYSRAKRLYQQVQQKGVSEDVHVLVSLAKAHLGLKELDDAAKISQQAIAILSKGGIKSIDAYVVRGEALAGQGLTEQACKFYAVAVQLDPDNQVNIQRLRALRKIQSDTIAVRKRIGEAMGERNYDAAIAACSEGLVIDKTCVKLMSEMHYKRAQAYKMLAKVQARTPPPESTSTSTGGVESPYITSYKKCLQDSNRALYYDHAMLEAFFMKIESLQTLNRHEEAVSELEQLASEKQYRRNEEIHEKLKQAKLLLKRSKRKDLYALLLLDKGSLSTDEEIRKAYKKAALKWHPDRHSAGTEEKKKEAEIKFKEIQSAFELLTDPQKRRLYDQGYDEEEINQKIEMEKQQQSYHNHGFGSQGHYGFH